MPTEQVSTVNANGIEDLVAIIQTTYHAPGFKSHMWVEAFVEDFFAKGPEEIHKITHQQFAQRYTKREFLMDFPAGFLCEKLDSFLAANNKPTTGILYNYFPPTPYVKQLLRCADSLDSLGKNSQVTPKGLCKPKRDGIQKTVKVDSNLKVQMADHVTKARSIRRKRPSKLVRLQRKLKRQILLMEVLEWRFNHHKYLQSKIEDDAKKAKAKQAQIEVDLQAAQRDVNVQRTFSGRLRPNTNAPQQAPPQQATTIQQHFQNIQENQGNQGNQQTQANQGNQQGPNYQ